MPSGSKAVSKDNEQSLNNKSQAQDTVNSSSAPPQKRQRVSRACDSCRKKKVKCDGIRPNCTNCRNSSSQCVYTIIEKKTGVPRKRATNIVKLESRLDRIESMLEALVPAISSHGKSSKKTMKDQQKSKKRDLAMSSGEEEEDDADDPNDDPNDDYDDEDDDDDNDNMNDDNDDDNPNDADDDFEDEVKEENNNIRYLPAKSQRSSSSPDEWQVQDDDVPDGAYFFKFQPKPNKVSRNADMYSRSLARGNSQVCANGQAFALFSSNGIKWISEKIDDYKIGDRLADPFMQLVTIQQERIRPFVEPLTKPFPIDKNILELCVEAFHDGPTIWKFMIMPDELTEIVRAEFYDDSLQPNGYSELFILNAIISIALPFAYRSPELRERIESHLKISTDAEMYEIHKNYFVNSLFYSRRITLLQPSTTSLKALLLLMIALQCSNTPHPISFIVKTGVHIGLEMGLNRKESCYGLTREEANRRKCLWWMLYMFDHDVALKIGRSPDIRDCDVTIGLPEFDKDDNRTQDAQFLSLMVNFFHLSNDCYVRLFSPSAGNKRPVDLVRDVHYCDEQLEKWKNSVPDEYKPDCDLDFFQIHEPTHETQNREFHTKITILYVHYLYYQLLSSIHRTVAYHPSWIYLLIEDEKAALTSKKGNTNNNSSNNGASSGGATSPAMAAPKASSSPVGASVGNAGSMPINSGPSSNPKTASDSAPSISSSSAAAAGASGSGSATSPSTTISDSINISKSGIHLNGSFYDNSPLIALHHKYPRLFTSLDICNHASRRSIELIQRTKTWGQLFIWGSLYFATSSFITLFVKCLAKPFDPTTRLDLDIMKTLPAAFRDLDIYQSGQESLNLVLQFWVILHEVAQLFVEKAHNNPNNANLSPSSTTSGPTPNGNNVPSGEQHPRRTRSKREKNNNVATKPSNTVSGSISPVSNIGNIPNNNYNNNQPVMMPPALQFQDGFSVISRNESSSSTQQEQQQRHHHYNFQQPQQQQQSATSGPAALQPPSEGLRPSEGSSVYSPLTNRVNLNNFDGPFPNTNGSIPIPAQAPGMLPSNGLGEGSQIPTPFYGNPEMAETMAPGSLPYNMPTLDTVDYLPDPSMVQSLFHITSYPFSWDADFSGFSGFNQSP